MNIIQRVQAPTPKFFRKLRNIGLTIAAIGTTIIASPVVLPAIVITIAGYSTLAGGVLSAVSQITTGREN